MLEPVTQLISNVDWFNDEMARSGITPEAVNNLGIAISVRRGGAGYDIPYYDYSGSLLHYRRRNRTSASADAGNPSFPRARGDNRYEHPPGQPVRLYVPRSLPDYNPVPLISDPGVPLFVCEGEKKAACLQLYLAGKGSRALVVGVPGINNILSEGVRGDLQQIVFSATLRDTRINRNVIIIYDFNDSGAGETNARKFERQAADWFRSRGATVLALRWPVEPGAGVQKIDDWLVAGGDLSAAIEHSTAVDALGDTEVSRMLDWFNDRYVVVRGTIWDQETREAVRKEDFKTWTQNQWVMMPAGRGNRMEQIYGYKIWLDHERRLDARGIINRPSPAGEDHALFVDEMFNVAPPWPTLRVPWQPSDAEILDIIETWEFLLTTRVQSDEELSWLRQALAHPFVQPVSYRSNVLTFTDDGGGGKGLLFEVLKKAAGKLAIKVNDRTLASGFTSIIAGKLFLNLDDPDGSKSKAIGQFILQTAGNVTLTVEGKGVNAGEIENFSTIIITTNELSASRIKVKDRRNNIFLGRSLNVPEVERVVAALDSPFIAQAIWQWARSVDMRGYNPGRLGPATQAREEAIRESRTPIEVFLDEPWDFFDKDIATVDEIAMALSSRFRNTSYNASTITKAIRQRHGENAVRGKSNNIDNRIRMGSSSSGRKVCMVAINNVDKWLFAGAEEWRQEQMRVGGDKY